MALFNELYDLASGGTLWSAASEADPVGQFGILECIDYRWYESLEDTHKLEVWTGINFGLVAFFVPAGRRAEALEITESVVRQIYNYGIQFRTPEAITAVGTFRACQ